MPQDAYTLQFVQKELSSLLVGGKISKITQPEKDELAFIIYTKNHSVKLEISLSAQNNRISLSDDEKPNPQVAPNFCMLLRKHLQNAEILQVEQIGFERILRLALHCVSDFSDQVLHLYLEIMGKYSNAVLVHEGIILGALKMTTLEENTRRILFSGAKYQLPTPQDKVNPKDLAELTALFADGLEHNARYIADKVQGIALSTAQELLKKYPNVSAQQLYQFVNTDKIEPCVVYASGVPQDFKAYSANPNKKCYDSILEAQKAYYSYLYTKRTFENKQKKLLSALNGAIKKIEKRRNQIDMKLLECADLEEVKLKGELITANLYQCQKGMTHIEVMNYYEADCPTISIPLDSQLSPSQNAQKYYKKYAKLKRTAIVLQEQQKEVEEKITYLLSIRSNIERAEILSDLTETEEELIALQLVRSQENTKKKKVVTTPYRVFMVDGFQIIAGRNNLQNERLTKSLSANDIWLHTQKYHSSHIGILTEGRTVPDHVLQIAGEICAFYSDGKAGTKIPVDYVEKKMVKKPPHSPTGFVIYSEYQTMLVDPHQHSEFLEVL